MVSFLGHLFVGMLTVGAAHADDDAKDDAKKQGVKSMLDALPEIAAPKSAVEDKPKETEPLGYNGYNLVCSKAVLRHFKAPQSAVKENPDIELELLIQVAIDGRVLGVGAGVRSGDKKFDKAAVKALNKAGDMPPPPSGWSVERDRVILSFKGR
jgi:TonB family protein